MTSNVRVGDTLALPSGEVVYIATAADPARPWRAHQMGGLWGIRREQPPGQVHREAWQHYTGDKAIPLLLVEGDAVAFANGLNRVRPTNSPIATAWRGHGGIERTGTSTHPAP